MAERWQMNENLSLPLGAAERNPPIVPAAQSRPIVPGLVYRPNFLGEEAEQRLVEWIDMQAWSNELKRRVQHYGWRYDYGGRRVDPSMRLGKLPAVLLKLARRLFDAKLVPQMPDQVIVNEYLAGQGISAHMDAGSFADGDHQLAGILGNELPCALPQGPQGQRGALAARTPQRRRLAWRCAMEVEARDKKPRERPAHRRRGCPAAAPATHLLDVPQGSAQFAK